MILQEPRQLTIEDLVASNISKKYWNAEVFSFPHSDNIATNLKPYFNFIFKINQVIESGANMLLLSPRQSHNGKTTLAVAILKIFIIYGLRSYYIDFENLVQYKLNKMPQFGMARNSDILVVDNIKFFNTFNVQVLEKLLVERHDALKNTIFILEDRLEDLSSKTISIIDNSFVKVFTNDIVFKNNLDFLLD